MNEILKREPVDQIKVIADELNLYNKFFTRGCISLGPMFVFLMVSTAMSSEDVFKFAFIVLCANLIFVIVYFFAVRVKKRELAEFRDSIILRGKIIS